MSKKPPNSKLNSITRTPSRLATPWFLTQMPMNRQIAAAARLNNMINKMYFQNSAQAGTNPVMGYIIAPIMSGGSRRNGTMSKTTLAA